MAKEFASRSDMTEKKITFSEIGRDLWAFTAEGDPNTGVIIGDDCVMIVDAQATPRLAAKVVENIRTVTDKPIKYVVLSHYHAVRVLGASAYNAEQIIASQTCRAMVAERGKEDWDSEFERFPRLFQGHESIPGLTWPTMTFTNKMSVYLGKRRVDLMHLGRAHTAGDIVAWVPESTYRPAAAVAARGGTLKEAWDAVRADCDPKFSDYAIYEHCLPFNVARAYDEALGMDTPRIWTAERDKQMWGSLQG